MRGRGRGRLRRRIFAYSLGLIACLLGCFDSFPGCRDFLLCSGFGWVGFGFFFVFIVVFIVIFIVFFVVITLQCAFYAFAVGNDGAFVFFIPFVILIAVPQSILKSARGRTYP